MKLNIGKQTVEEIGKQRFKLVKDQLYLVNHIHTHVHHPFPDDTMVKVIPQNKLRYVQKRLTQAKREVVI